MEAIIAFLSSKAGIWLLGAIGVGSIGALMDKMMKKFITDQRLNAVREFLAYYIAMPGDWIGEAFTSAGTKLPVLGKIWNKTIEPWVIIFLETVLAGILDGLAELVRRLIKAMQSDSPSTKG